LALFYADTSALVKLVWDEPESAALRAVLDDADLVSCELVLAELPRAIRRAASHDPELPLDLLIARAEELLDAIALLPLDRPVLEAAGALTEPALRALDAIHVAAAIQLSPLDAFVGYDERQSAAARLAGLRGRNRDLWCPSFDAVNRGHGGISTRRRPRCPPGSSRPERADKVRQLGSPHHRTSYQRPDEETSSASQT
jgi:predicted nucleic acid-binding protein